jgi:hypothetical protein
MDEAPSTPKLSRRSPAAASGWSAATMVRAAARVLFAIAGRTGAQRFRSAAWRSRARPPLDDRPLGHAPRAPGGAISLSTCALAAVPSVIARRCPERLTARRPVLLAARMLARNKFLYSISRPACGRPPPAAVLCRRTGRVTLPGDRTFEEIRSYRYKDRLGGLDLLCTHARAGSEDCANNQSKRSCSRNLFCDRSHWRQACGPRQRGTTAV